MINVYSFQKMIQNQDGSEQKNISKTSQFVFGQNYKKLVANAKPNFDFRKFLQKHSNTRKNFATMGQKDNSKRNPLQEVSTTELNNQQVTLQTKAFKIRCYSRKLTKQSEKQDQISTSKLPRYKPKIYPAKQYKSSKKVFTCSSNNDTKKFLRMHKLDNYEQLQPISSNIKIVYNDFISQSNKITDKAVIIDMTFFVSCVKGFAVKSNDRDRDTQHFKKKAIYLIKRIIEEKYPSYEMEKNLGERPQIIFKVRKDQEIHDLLKSLSQCEFGAFFCVFSVQNKHVENSNPYNLMRINNLAQNIIVLDSVQNLISFPPLINSRHFIGLSTISQKSNFGMALQSFFHQLQNLQIRFCVEDFEGQDLIFGQIYDTPCNQWLEKAKQKRNLKDMKKSCREKKQRCHSSYENNSQNNNSYEEKTLENFKQKMLKYLKIINIENNLETKRLKQLKNSSEQELLECCTSRQRCSKTNNQLVSELIRLNSHVHKQISSYQKKLEETNFGLSNEQNESICRLRFQKVYINNLY